MNLKNIFTPSKNIVVREIEGELLIVPLISGISDKEGDLFTLNETGKVFWNLLDGKKNLIIIINELAKKYSISKKVVEKEIIGLVQELVKRGILVFKEL